MTYYGEKKFGDPKPVKIDKPKKKYIFKKKPTGEKAVFEEIYEERPHASQVSGNPILYPTPSNFLHVLPKGKNKYPLFKLNKQNIILGTDDEHYLWDHCRMQIKDDPMWAPIFELEASLKEQYKKL
ncbi:MAG: hypothetical protein V4721_10290 [Bacteroidota bacterium]